MRLCVPATRCTHRVKTKKIIYQIERRFSEIQRKETNKKKTKTQTESKRNIRRESVSVRACEREKMHEVCAKGATEKAVNFSF